MQSQPDVWPGPVGRPARAHWWSAQEPPPASRSRPISARRAYAEVLLVFSASLTAGIVEETVVLAFVVTTLRQARRPLPEIVLVAVLLRCSYHDYYGLGVLGIAVWAAIFVWLFLRTGSVLPLIVVHVLWDTTIFLGHHWHAVMIATPYRWLFLLLAARISWMIELHARHAGPPGRSPPGAREPGAALAPQPLRPPPRRGNNAQILLSSDKDAWL